MESFKELMGFDPGNEVIYEDGEDDGSIPAIQKITKKNNILLLWGNPTTMNLNNLVLENIVQSAYYKNYLVEVVTFQQAVEEILYNVKHLEPWERGTKKLPGSGMCGSVRGVGTGGVISSAFCLLYKLHTMRITRKQVVSLINNTQSVFVRGIGFLLIRFNQPPTDLLAWFEPYLEDTEEFDPRAGGGDTITIGQFVRQILTKLDWYGTLFPRLPFAVQKEIEAKFGNKRRERTPERKRGRSPARSGRDTHSSAAPRRKRCSHHLKHHHCHKHRKRCPTKAKKSKPNEKSAKKDVGGA
ncbi:Ubiquitin carboxyl-terminal hydrolase [Aphelenchoides bicaudatus]|nr:Ubiquitin carboxyl-terminal hydrolase [Aphelenchoides bicaudatus]